MSRFYGLDWVKLFWPNLNYYPMLGGGLLRLNHCSWLCASQTLLCLVFYYLTERTDVGIKLWLGQCRGGSGGVYSLGSSVMNSIIHLSRRVYVHMVFSELAWDQFIGAIFPSVQVQLKHTVFFFASSAIAVEGENVWREKLGPPAGNGTIASSSKGRPT